MIIIILVACLIFDPQRSHLRYKILLRKMNLEPFTGQSS